MRVNRVDKLCLRCALCVTVASKPPEIEAFPRPVQLQIGSSKGPMSMQPRALRFN